MSKNKIINIVLVTLCYPLLCSANTDYFATTAQTQESEDNSVDPHSFYYDKDLETEIKPAQHRKIKNYEDDDQKAENSVSSCIDQLRLCRQSPSKNTAPTQIQDELFSRRFVNMVLSRTQFNQDGKLFSGYLELEASEGQLEALKKFGKGELSLREIDSILNNVLKHPASDRIYDSAKLMYNVSQWIYEICLYLLTYMICNKEIILGAIFFGCCIQALRKVTSNLWMSIFAIVVAIFFVSFLITWWKLLQEAEINHMTLQAKHMKMPIHCEPEKMSFFDKFTSMFSVQDDCKKYHEAMMKTPFLQVTPVQALSHTLAHVIYEPLEIFGKALGKFLQNLTADTPWLVTIILYIIIPVIFLPLLAICCILLLGGSMSFGGFGPLSFFTLRGRDESKKRRKSLESNRERQPIEIMLNITAHPKMLENPVVESTDFVPSNKLSIKNKSEEEILKDASNACELREAKKESNGSGDCASTNDGKNSKKETVDAKVKTDVKESHEDGSGDNAFE